MSDRTAKLILATFLLPSVFCLCESERAFAQIRWRSETNHVDATGGDSYAGADGIAAAVVARAGEHVLVRLDQVVNTQQRATLESAGLRLLGPLGGGSFFASILPDADPAALSEAGLLESVETIRSAWKRHPALAAGNPPSWAIVDTADENDPIVATYVSFHADVPLTPDAEATVRAHRAVIRSSIRSVNALVVELPLSEIEALAEEDAVQWIEPPLPPLGTANDGCRQATQVDIVQDDAQYDLDGAGVTVLVYDGGTADEGHPDLAGRVAMRDSSGISSHSTHVACTIGGDGFASGGLRRGMAPGVMLESYGFEMPGGLQEGFLYTDPGDIEQDYDEAINVYGADIANNSIGTNVCENGYDCEWTGDYGITAQLIDAIVGGSLGTPFPVIWAAGNERDCDRCGYEGVHTPAGYHSTAPPAGAKNHILVGAVNSNDLSMTPFSSWGPTDDGRLKPDVVASGCEVGDDFGVTSGSTLGGYVTLCGTSMAAPVATGASALLLQDFRAQFPQQGDFRNSTLKALLVHGAADLDPPGPDYRSGYGAVRIKDTIDFMRTGNFLESQVDHEGVYALLLHVEPGAGALKVTLAWDDVPGTPNVEPSLVNDLDLRVYDPAGGRSYPWTLRPAEPSVPARRTGDDHLNNIEQVVVDQPEPGLWLVEVYGYEVPQGPQSFSLCYHPDVPSDCDGDGTPDDEQLLSSPELDCSGNRILDVCEPDCDSDGIADSCALSGGTSSDCNINGIPDDCEEWVDCNTNGAFDACDVGQGYSNDCNGNWVPDKCEPDCNGNGAADECDIGEGISEDYDRDGIPDECQPLVDCNFNFIADGREIADGIAEDFNGNGIPDECELVDPVLYVDVANCPGPGTGTPEDPFCRIQDGIDESISGQEVVVAPGVYIGAGNRDLDFGGRRITLRSVDPDDPQVVAGTVVDCDAKGRALYFHNGETRDAVVDGLTLRNGLAALGNTPGAFVGAGVYCKDSHPTIRNCVITEGFVGPIIAYTFGGGGVYCERSHATIENCTISANFTYNHGGGVYCYDGSNVVIRNCTLTDNISFSGAGIACGFDSRATVENSTIAYNMAGTGVVAGGIVGYRRSEVTVRDSVIFGNETGSGGGVIQASSDTDLWLLGSTVFGNGGSSESGGLYYFDGSLGGIHNSIVWGNADESGAEYIFLENQCQLRVSFSDIQGGEQGVQSTSGSSLKWQDGNIDVDPAFVDQDGDDLRLTEVSPCIDSGDWSFDPIEGETDIEGDPRVQYCRVDMGADESSFFADCDTNTLADACEILDGAQDCDFNFFLDECQDTSEDCNDNGIWDPCDVLEGAEDCNHNLVPDECDIAEGTAADCNDNGIPDWCDVIWGTSEDTNGNGILDECELCASDEECSDGLFCNGAERCIAEVCRPGNGPCPGQFCIEELHRCSDCLTDGQCDDGNECTINVCDLDQGACVESDATGACDDGEPCTENDTCVEGRCFGTIIPGCGPMYSLRAVAVNSVPVAEGPSSSVTVNQGDLVTCEVFVEGWDPRLLYGYNVMIDPSGYLSGTLGSLAPLVDPSPAAGAFIDQSHPDFVFSGAATLTAVWNSEPTFYQYVGLVLYEEDCAPDPGVPAYLATLILVVSSDAAGAFTVCLDDTDADGDLDPEFSYLRGCDSWPIKPIDFECVTLNVFADCNDNGIPDNQDIAEGTSEDCTGNGWPDECEPDCNENSVADSCDIADGTSQDCNGNTVPDSCDVNDGTSEDCNNNVIPDECEPDCNGNDVADECDITEGTSEDCNINVVPDECDLASGSSQDCDDNAVPDECQDTSDDCNENGVWDECDVAYGTSEDCNDNHYPDECDIADGTSGDCDQNGVPDECPDYFPQLMAVSEFDGASGVTFNGIEEEDGAGRTVTGAGDVNGDGIADILISAPGADPGELAEAGECYVIFGRPGSWTHPFELASLFPGGGVGLINGFAIVGAGGDEYLGDGLSSAGDFNADGIDDILLGAPGVDVEEQEDVGRAYVLFGHFLIGASDVLSVDELDGTDGFAINGVGEGELTGRNVALAGDVNGDTVDDILISAHVADVGGQDFVGRVYVLFGGTGPWPEAIELSALLPENGGDGTSGFVINGIDGNDLLGSALAGAGDINDDGFADIVLGAYSADPGGRPYAGQAYVVFGGPMIAPTGEINLSDLDGDNGFLMNGIDALDLAGDSVAAAGDVNSDGIGDLLIGAVWADPHGSVDAGETYVIFGHSGQWEETLELSDLLPGNGGDGTIGFVINGTNTRDLSGFSAAGAGDVNDDGNDDIMVGAYGSDPFGISNAGEVYVIFGHPDPWPPSFDLASLIAEPPPVPPLGFVVQGADPGGSLGQSVACPGDVNNDGFSDIVLGAPNASPNGIETAGKSYIVFGRHVFTRDCNGNGVLDQCDILGGTSEDCNGDDIPDECQDSEVDCNGNGVWDLCDVIAGTSQDCNGNLIPDECDLASGDSEDCNENAAPDECEPTYPIDCNGNAIWDTCDIYAGTSGDCNVSAVPDECEPGGDQDCNANGNPDLCDIFEGTSQDINANAVPDECELHSTIYVSVATCNPDTGGTGIQGDPFCRIQDGIDSAGGGAEAVIEVVVADGLYTGEGNVNLDISRDLPEGETRAIRVRSNNGPAGCVIDCAGARNAFLFERGEGRGARVEGFTMLDASRSAVLCSGNSNPVIHNCVMTRNLRNGNGAAVKCTSSSPTISHCLIAGNYVNGIYCVDESNPMITGCVIVGNHGSNGGGIHCANNSAPTITHCTIARNAAAWEGGGIYAFLGIPTVTNSIVWGNDPEDITGIAGVSFSDVGGFWYSSGNVNRDPMFIGGPAGEWTADGDYDPETRQTTLTDATASWQDGEFVGCTVNVATSSLFQLEYPVIENTATTLTIWGDEIGLAEAGGAYRVFDYRLKSKSPCVNAGDFNLLLAPGEVDIDGNERLRRCRVDMGAYESPYLDDCNGNGLSDACEALAGTVDDCDVNGVPDVCEPDCNLNGVVDACDISKGKSRDENSNGVPDECEPAHCDLDGDGRVGTSDIEYMQWCRHGPDTEFDPACAVADLNSDHRVNDADWRLFVKCFRKYGMDSGDPPGGSGPWPPSNLRSR